MSEEKKKQDSPQSDLYMPLGWWSDIIRSVDSKIKLISEAYGYGSISLEVTITKGKVKDLIVKDKVRIRQGEQPQKPQNLTEKPKQ